MQPNLAIFVLIALGISIVHGQESAAQRHQMATNHLKHVAAEMSSRALEDFQSLAEWNRGKDELRRQLREMLGLDPLPPRTPLNVRNTGRLERSTHDIEKLVFESLPGLHVTANLYLPKDQSGARPAILYLCGHSPHPHGAKVDYQDRAIWFAANGFPCLVLDTLEFGEVAGIHHGTHNLNMWHWLSLGYTPAGTEVWNAMRALDYLETRPEVDPGRMGLTGISGGGAMTWYTAAVDERVAAAVPVCSTITFGSQAHHWVAAGQCDCIYYHNTYIWDFPVVAALIAPRPLLILSGRRDADFPPDGYHEVHRRAKRIYEFHGESAADRIREVDADVGHSDPPLFLREARQWMRRWLDAETAPLPDIADPFPLESPGDLACLDEIPADTINFQIQHRLTRPVALEKPDSAEAWHKRRDSVLGQLRHKVFRWFPTNTVAFETRTLPGTGGYMARYAGYKSVSFQTEPGVRIRAQLFLPKANPTSAPLLLYVKRAGDSIYHMDTDELLPVVGRYAVMVLNPRFTELPISAAEHANVERTAVWIGRTVASMQVWDIRRALQWIQDESGLKPARVVLYGKGATGILALYASLFESHVAEVIVNNPPASHWDEPALLNVLRITDIPEVAGMLAPRRLVSLTKLPEAFDLTRHVYHLESALEQFGGSGSLPEALRVWELPWQTAPSETATPR